MEFYNLPQEIKEYVYMLSESDPLPIEGNEIYYLNLFIYEINRFINEDCEDEFVEDYEYFITIAETYIRQAKIENILS